jgi:6-phospho-beta-glucosidase
MAKVACIGGGGVRTPLVVFGMNECARLLGVDEIALYDLDRERAAVMAALGRAVVRQEGGTLRVREAATLEDAADRADFELSSIRVGGIAARTHDEQVAITHGYPGQETTGPTGMAMALRTVPVAVEQARAVHRVAPRAWLINFTNPAGLITQAILDHTEARAVGIWDTPSEMLHRRKFCFGFNSLREIADSRMKNLWIMRNLRCALGQIANSMPTPWHVTLVIPIRPINCYQCQSNSGYCP